MCISKENKFIKNARIGSYEEKYRPQFHYSPAKNWMNDPNGLVYYEGEYHLFYQHTVNSTSPDFPRMHWGHAVSKDLVHWEELPPAITPGEDGAIFSGSAVADMNNTSGFFNEEGSGLVAIYTNEGNQAQPGKPQVQSLSYSRDQGRTWTRFEGNPVLLPASETADFRDPKVFWHEESSKWVMALAARDRIEFYTSEDLRAWSFASEFGSTVPFVHRGVFECPDIFQVPVDNDPNNKKWVLSLSVGDLNGGNMSDPQPPAGGSGMMYFIGHFDGQSFISDKIIESIHDIQWIDFGSDFYAAVTWNGIPKEDGRVIWIGWMNNWRYANKLPSLEWRGNMSLPREIQLRTCLGGLRLIQLPVKELSKLRNPMSTLTDLVIKPGDNLLSEVTALKAEIIAEFEIGTAIEFGFKLRKSSSQETIIGYDVVNEALFLDRTNAGSADFHPDFAAKHTVTLKPEHKRIQVTIYVDGSNIELFGNEGIAVITDLVFPEPESQGLELYAVGGSVKVISLQISDMTGLWVRE
ncbi:glycoside hydrolase family 32 protein [Paenibacillus sp. HWE-109]|uniref:glycoside hydrolase family 32 protein n=1 Tax=Paenibacillus sp. HWE-109 TaxID=1306526 RepID=UPI001EE0BD16|nr:glycoside hydrolase family 32 protein [Paenibacillus sp. HWE-109]UKS27889.1 glycoside hydrolase family 32 protein [Paenibacillus sp. HWE-109]